MFDAPLAAGASDQRFTGDTGVKRFNEVCSTTSFTAHIRLYSLTAPDNRTPAAAVTAMPGAKVVGTVHLDFDDTGGCSGRIHGYPDVPTYNASHGCLRVPVPDSWAIYSWVRMGDVVWVEP